MDSLDDLIVTGISAFVMIAIIAVVVVLPVILLFRWVF